MARRRPSSSESGRAMVGARLLDLISEERKTVAGDLSFLLSSSGVGARELPPDESGLKELESAYWDLVSESDEEYIEIFERKMAIFLGECIIRSYGGEWLVYNGPEIVYSPVVIRVESTGLHRDVFLLCTELRNNPGVLGQKQRRALRIFFKGASRKGFS